MPMISPRPIMSRRIYTTRVAGAALALAVFVGAVVWSHPVTADDKTDAKARDEATLRLRKVTLAFFQYLEDYKTFPPAALVAKDGRVLLSWRVLILPYIGETKLFREFHLEEPWDSPHNKKLLPKMPRLYAPVRGKAEPGHTCLQVFTGPGTVFEGAKVCRIRDIADGTSNTILMVEAAEPVPWTKPADLPYHAKKPLPKLGFAFPKIFLFSTADGSSYVGKRDFDERVMRLAITRG